MALQKYGPSTCHLYTMLPPSAILIILSKKCKVITHFWFIFSLDENLESSASVKMIDFAHVWPAEVFLIIIIMSVKPFHIFTARNKLKTGIEELLRQLCFEFWVMFWGELLQGSSGWFSSISSFVCISMESDPLFQWRRKKKERRG